MKLYELKHGQRFTVPDTDFPLLTFDHPDGMYSVCYTENKELVQLAMCAEVEVVDD